MYIYINTSDINNYISVSIMTNVPVVHAPLIHIGIVIATINVIKTEQPEKKTIVLYAFVGYNSLVVT